MMDEISREWWIGYFCTFVGMISAIALAAWLLLPRPEAPAPVALVDAPPPKFVYPRRPEDPAALELLEKAMAAIRALPPCRIEAEWISTYHAGTTPEDRRESGGQVIRQGETRWLIRGDWFRKESRVSISERHPKDGILSGLRDGPYERWELYNDELIADYHGGEEFITACPRRLLLPESRIKRLLSAAELLDGFRDTWARAEADRGVELQWSIRDEGELVLIEGDPIPGSPDQHIRCEIALDPTRDYLVRRASYWMNEVLYAERIIDLQQLPDGRWFPKRTEYRRGDVVSVEACTEVEIFAEIDDSQFQMESIPCDFETVLVKKRKDEGFFNHDYFKFADGNWNKVARPLIKDATPNATLEWAVTEE